MRGADASLRGGAQDRALLIVRLPTTRTSKNTALLHLAATTPPAVFADAIGLSIGAATRWAALAGASWNTYATDPR